VFTAFLLLLSLNGCGQQNSVNVTEPVIVGDSGGNLGFFKRDAQSQTGSKSDFTLFKSKTFYYDSTKGYYIGGTIQMGHGNGSNFHVIDSSLTPPPSIPVGENVTIGMQVNYNSTDKELVFTFGPSGCHFMPAARIKLDYRQLGNRNIALYYINENGQYIKQKPDYINTKKRFMFIYIDHFSRYAVAISR
jgi:hypothetical protein